jgi:hypothetical protein
MKVKLKEASRQVKVLADPEPSFMSLVDHGANQTPFNAVKADNVIVAKAGPVQLNGSGRDHVRSLIEAGHYNASDSWSFDSEDGNKLLGGGKDWERYGSVHLAVDPAVSLNTKGHWKYPVAKASGSGEVVYRSGLIAAKDRAAQRKAASVEQAASDLLALIDKKEGDSTKSHKSQEEQAMSKRGKGAARKSVITKMTLSKSVYKTEDAARKVLDNDIGITDYVLGTDPNDPDVWVAKSKTEHSIVGKARSTGTKYRGVTAFVGELAPKAMNDGADPDEDGDDDADANGDDDNDSGNGKNKGGKVSDPIEDPEAATSTDNENNEVDPNNNSDLSDFEGTMTDDYNTEQPEGTEKPTDDKNKMPKPAGKKRASRITSVDGQRTAKTATDTVLRFPESTKKYDNWSAYMSNAGNLYQMIEDGTAYDGLPPGVEDILNAVYLTAGNILGDADALDADKQKAIEQLGQDFAALTFGLYEVFKKAMDVEDDGGENSEKAAKLVKNFRLSVKRAKSGAALTVKSASAPANTESLESIIKKAVSASLGEFSKKINGQLSKVQQQVDEISTRGTTRKSLANAVDNVIVQEEDDGPIAKAERETILRMWGAPISTRSGS